MPRNQPSFLVCLAKFVFLLPILLSSCKNTEPSDNFPTPLQDIEAMCSLMARTKAELRPSDDPFLLWKAAVHKRTLSPEGRAVFEVLESGNNRCQALHQAAAKAGLPDPWSCPALCPFAATLGLSFLEGIHLPASTSELPFPDNPAVLAISPLELRDPDRLLHTPAKPEPRPVVIFADALTPAKTLFTTLKALHAQGHTHISMATPLESLYSSGEPTTAADAGLVTPLSHIPLTFAPSSPIPRPDGIWIGPTGFAILEQGTKRPPARKCSHTLVTLCLAKPNEKRSIHQYDWSGLYNTLLSVKNPANTASFIVGASDDVDFGTLVKVLDVSRHLRNVDPGQANASTVINHSILLESYVAVDDLNNPLPLFPNFTLIETYPIHLEKSPSPLKP